MCNVYGDVQEMQLVIGNHLKKCFWWHVHNDNVSQVDAWTAITEK